MGSDPVDEVFEEFNSVVNMSPTELESFGESDNFDAYESRKSGGEPIDKPREDILRLQNTPKDEWRDVDDGFNEVEEANQAISFISRMSGNDSGEPMPDTDPGLSKRDASLLNWGHDPNPGKSDFVGDRQR